MNTYYSNLQSYIKKYLDENKSKVIVLTGPWGSGKTFFYNEFIEPSLGQSIYVSLFGINNIAEIKQYIFMSAYLKNAKKKKEDIGSRTTAFLAKTFSLPCISFDYCLELNKKNKLEKGQDVLANHVVCFDDFERLSENIELKELFGFISNLSIEFKTNIILIMNSNILNGSRHEKFVELKEKVVNKIIKFTPDIEDLFCTIFDSQKTDSIPHKKIIMEEIKKWNLLNARIYVYLLEHLIEFVKIYRKLTEDEVRTFVHTIISYKLEGCMPIYIDLKNTPNITNELLGSEYQTVVLADFLNYNFKSFLDSKNNTKSWAFQSKSLFTKSDFKTYMMVSIKHFAMPSKDGSKAESNERLKKDTLELCINDGCLLSRIYIIFKNCFLFCYGDNIDPKTLEKIQFFIENGYAF